MLKVNCDICEKELQEQGGLIFGPPDSFGMVKKIHVCFDCYYEHIYPFILTKFIP